MRVLCANRNKNGNLCSKTHSIVVRVEHVNIFVACFTTWWGRLHLYEALELSQERCLYFDTDSALFVSEPVQPNPQLGQLLGE